MPEDILSKLNASTEDEDIESKLDEEKKGSEDNDELEDILEGQDGTEVIEIDSEEINTIHNGLRLDIDGLKTLMSEKLTRIIVFAGLPEAGKTTLLNAFYQPLVKKGIIAEYEFKSSLTLVGFERRDALCRMSSGNNEPTFVRTKSGEMDILHLEVCNPNNIINLAITDLSGEDFKDMLKSSSFCQEFTLLGRADCFSLLIDGDKITDLKQRQQVKANSLKLLDIFLEEKMLNYSTKIYVIFTKWDIVDERMKENEKHKAFVDTIKKLIEEKMSSYEVVFMNFTRNNIFKFELTDAIDINNFFNSFVAPKNNWEYNTIVEKSQIDETSIKRYFSKIK